MRGEDDDAQTGPAALQLLEQADAVHLIHAQVGDDQVGAEAPRRRERGCAALDGFDIVILGAQANRQQAQQSRIVVDHENASLAFGG